MNQSKPDIKSEAKSEHIQFTKEDYQRVDYKNLDLLKKYTSERGKILPRRLTMATAKEQREIAQAIKRARFLSLIAPLIR